MLEYDPKTEKKQQAEKAMAITAILVLAALIILFFQPRTETGYHTHVDFAVYLDGEKYDFVQEKFMSMEGNEKNPYTHLHDMDGNVIHFHAEGVSLNDFFQSIGMRLTQNCFRTETGQNYCNTTEKTLKMFVNGNQNNAFGTYIPNDLDRILISYGDETPNELQEQLDSVTDNACYYSEKCPERGIPPLESCSGGACPV